MPVNEWTMLATRARSDQKQRVDEHARKLGITPAAMIYAILFKATNGFTSFDCMPTEMPRGFVVRQAKEATNE